MLWQGLCPSPRLYGHSGRTVLPESDRGVELVKLRANIEVPLQGSHIFLPPVHFLHEEGIFCHGVMSVKDKGI